jgi:hypothetical protein
MIGIAATSADISIEPNGSIFIVQVIGFISLPLDLPSVINSNA